jgi:hypothetical protein
MRWAIVVFSVFSAACVATQEREPAAAPPAGSLPDGASSPGAGAAPPVSPPSLLPPLAASPVPVLLADPPAPPIPKGTAVLHIGDSFALAGFVQSLKPRMQALGTRYEVKAETSSFTTTWASKMNLLVSNTQPDLVIINLGANEVSNTDPPAHAGAVRRIVQAIGDRPCVWVSPPLWRKDTGIIDVIRQNSAPCRFFDSDTLVKKPIPRQSDRIHPNDEGGAIWAEAFWIWLQAERASAAPEGGASKKPSPWRLKAAPAEEHQPRPK